MPAFDNRILWDWPNVAVPGLSIRYNLERRSRAHGASTWGGWQRVASLLAASQHLSSDINNSQEYQARVQTQAVGRTPSDWLESAVVSGNHPPVFGEDDYQMLASGTVGMFLANPVIGLLGAVDQENDPLVFSGDGGGIHVTASGQVTYAGLLPAIAPSSWNNIGIRVRDSYGGEDAATLSVSTSVAPTVTYTPAAPTTADSSITANFSSTSGITSYQWQLYSSGAWLNVFGETSRTFDDGSPLGNGNLFRITWVRNGVREYGPAVLVTLGIVPPVTPSAPTLVSRTTTTLTVRVAEVDGATSYRFRYSTNSSVTDFDPGIVSADNEVTITGLSPNTNYWIDARAQNSAGSSSYSADLATSTSALATPAPTVTYTPAAPTTADSSITANFSSTSGITSYRWQRYNIAHISPSWGDLSGTDAATRVLLGPFTSTLHEFRITWVRNGVREYGPSVRIDRAPPDPPAGDMDWEWGTVAPTADSSGSIGGGEYQLSWTRSSLTLPGALTAAGNDLSVSQITLVLSSASGSDSFLSIFAPGASSQELISAWESAAEAFLLEFGSTSVRLPGPNYSGNSQRDSSEDYDWRYSATVRAQFANFVVAWINAGRPSIAVTFLIP